MDWVLCDELLQEIFLRLPTTSAASVAAVSRRWRGVLLSSLTSLTLRLPHHSQFPLPLLTSLTSLTLLPISHDPIPPSPLPIIANLPRPLRHLRLLLGPIPVASLHHPALRHLHSLHLSSLQPLSFHWLPFLPLLRHLTVLDCTTGPNPDLPTTHSGHRNDNPEEPQPLNLESLSLTAIRSPDPAFPWLFRRCRRLLTLQLRGCECAGGDEEDGLAFCLASLRRLDLRTSRAIADVVLRLAAERSPDLEELLLYDGGSREALRAFLVRTRAPVRVLDLRLPLDLDDSHLRAVAARDGVLSLRLQSCCLVTGEGLRWLARSSRVCGSLEELALVNCDVVEREEGVVTEVGQRLRGLRRLDLSYNEALRDREMAGLAAALGARVVELRLRGCGGLTGVAIRGVARWCVNVEEVDVRQCGGVGREEVDVVVSGCRRLGRMWVEDSKVSDDCRELAWRRGIQLC